MKHISAIGIGIAYPSSFVCLSLRSFILSFSLFLHSLISKMEELRRARANEFLSKWRESSLNVVKWMDTCEAEMASEVDGLHSLVLIRERLDDIDVSILGATAIFKASILNSSYLSVTLLVFLSLSKRFSEF